MTAWSGGAPSSPVWHHEALEEMSREEKAHHRVQVCSSTARWLHAKGSQGKWRLRRPVQPSKVSWSLALRCEEWAHLLVHTASPLVSSKT